MTKFTEEQLALLEGKIRFTEDGFDIIGDLPGNVWRDVLGSVGRDVVFNVGRSVGGDVGRNVLGTVWGNVGGDVLGSVGGNIGYGWVRKETGEDSL